MVPILYCATDSRVVDTAILSQLDEANSQVQLVVGDQLDPFHRSTHCQLMVRK